MQAIHEYLFREGRILVLHLTVVVWRQICFRHILIHQTIQVVCHRLRELNLLKSLFVDDLNFIVILVYNGNLGLHSRRPAQQGTQEHKTLSCLFCYGLYFHSHFPYLEVYAAIHAQRRSIQRIH